MTEPGHLIEFRRVSNLPFKPVHLFVDGKFVPVLAPVECAMRHILGRKNRRWYVTSDESVPTMILFFVDNCKSRSIYNLSTNNDVFLVDFCRGSIPDWLTVNTRLAELSAKEARKWTPHAS